MPEDHLPVLVALGFALALGVGMLWMSVYMGSRSGGRIKLSPYESGAPQVDRSRKRISILFFLIAIDFVVFDIEATFLFAWVAVLREGGWPLFGAVMVFVLLAVVGLLYVWRSGALDVLADARRYRR